MFRRQSLTVTGLLAFYGGFPGGCYRLPTETILPGIPARVHRRQPHQATEGTTIFSPAKFFGVIHIEAETFG